MLKSIKSKKKHKLPTTERHKATLYLKKPEMQPDFVLEAFYTAQPSKSSVATQQFRLRILMTECIIMQL